MWWDFDCWYSTPDSALLATMRSILAIDHVACQESALHGLGHWHWQHGAPSLEDVFIDLMSRSKDNFQ